MLIRSSPPHCASTIDLAPLLPDKISLETGVSNPDVLSLARETDILLDASRSHLTSLVAHRDHYSQLMAEAKKAIARFKHLPSKDRPAPAPTPSPASAPASPVLAPGLSPPPPLLVPCPYTPSWPGGRPLRTRHTVLSTKDGIEHPISSTATENGWERRLCDTCARRIRTASGWERLKAR